MLTPENAGCPKCFAPLEFQEVLYERTSHHSIVVQPDGTWIPDEAFDVEDPHLYAFHCNACHEFYNEDDEDAVPYQRNGHEMVAYVAAQDEKKKKS